jgi:hypothetical protein
MIKTKITMQEFIQKNAKITIVNKGVKGMRKK